MIWKAIVVGLCVAALYVIYAEMKIRSEKRITGDQATAERRERARQQVNAEIQRERHAAIRAWERAGRM